MSERRKPAAEKSNADRLASIEQRQQHLLQELDMLNERIEQALLDFSAGGAPAGAEA